MSAKKYTYWVRVDFCINDDFRVKADNTREAKEKALALYKKKFLKDKNFEITVEDKELNY